MLVYLWVPVSPANTNHCNFLGTADTQEDLKEYCTACNAMEAEIASLLAASSDQTVEGERVLPYFLMYFRYLRFYMDVHIHL